jgi:hypothetical protein
VEEVKDVESERGRRTFDRGRKPAGTKELDVFARVVITVTIADNEAVGARQVEDHEVTERRGVGTRVTSVFPKLNDQADGGEGASFEVTAIPFLRHVGDERPW